MSILNVLNYYSLSLCRLHRAGNALIAWALFSVFVIRVLPVGRAGTRCLPDMPMKNVVFLTRGRYG